MIPVRCGACDRLHNVADSHSGKKFLCRACGEVVRVPGAKRPEADARPQPAEDEIPLFEGGSAEAEEPDTWEPLISAPAPSVRRTSRAKRPRSSSQSATPRTWGLGLILVFGGVGLLGVSGVVLVIVNAVGTGFTGWTAASGGADAESIEEPPVAPDAPFDVAAVPLTRYTFDAQDLIQIRTGHRVYYDSSPHNPGAPGGEMTLHLYLPKQRQADRTLPCVLAPASGSLLQLWGASLDENLGAPIFGRLVSDGFAVVAFSVDGPHVLKGPGSDINIVPGYKGEDAQVTDSVRDLLNGRKASEAYRKFQAAQAGLVNARNAYEYALTVPEIDPEQIATFGQGSSGTLALLYAAHEPRIKGCIAFAPVTDVEDQLTVILRGLRPRSYPGVADFVQRSSPKTHAGRIECPVYLFHADGDAVVMVSQSHAFEREMKRLGKNVTLSTFTGGSHNTMHVTGGYDRAIGWLKRLLAEKAPADEGPAREPSPPNVAAEDRAPAAGARRRTPSHLIVVEYEEYRGQLPVDEAAAKALAEAPLVVPGTVEVDEQERTVTFQRFAIAGHTMSVLGSGIYSDRLKLQKFQTKKTTTRPLSK